VQFHLSSNARACEVGHSSKAGKVASQILLGYDNKDHTADNNSDALCKSSHHLIGYKKLHSDFICILLDTSYSSASGLKFSWKMEFPSGVKLPTPLSKVNASLKFLSLYSYHII